MRECQQISQSALESTRLWEGSECDTRQCQQISQSALESTRAQVNDFLIHGKCQQISQSALESTERDCDAIANVARVSADQPVGS